MRALIDGDPSADSDRALPYQRERAFPSSSNDNGSRNVTVLAVAIIVTVVGAIIITVASFAPLPGAVVAAAGTLFALGALLVGAQSVREARHQDLGVLSVLGRASKRALGWFLAWLP